MPADYGHIRATEGADGEEIDCFFGTEHDRQKVWVLDQPWPDTGLFDEAKVFLGYATVYLCCVIISVASTTDRRRARRRSQADDLTAIQGLAYPGRPQATGGRGMTIDNDFRFAHERTTQPAQPDMLGLLRGFVGSSPTGDAKRTWKGSGFNMLWRPNHGQSGNKDFFLQLMFTAEELSFLDITGSGIANRGFLQNDIFLGCVAYLQQIQDAFDDSGQHFESGHWLNVPTTTNPLEVATIARFGATPHGAAITLQGIGVDAALPTFDSISIAPFPIGQPNSPITFDEQDLSKPSTSRTPLDRVPKLDQVHLDNPVLLLSEALVDGETMVDTKVLFVASDATALSSLVGGGTADIAFLTGIGSPPAGGPNASTSFVQTRFWIEELQNRDGKTDHQLQYAQLVLLNFNGLSWPHVSVATLRPVPEP